MKTRLVAMLLVALAALGSAACGAALGTTISDTEQVSAEGINFLVVDNDNGEVIIQPLYTAENVVSVNYQLRNVDDIDFSVTRDGDRVIVRAEDNSGSFDSAQANLTIRLPARISIDVTTGNGKIDVTEMLSVTDLASGNGSITLRNTKGNAQATTGNGRIEVENHEGDLVATSGNGSVDITGHTGRIRVNTGNGSIDYEGMMSSGADNRMASGNGDITVTFHNEDLSFDAESDNDEVTVEATYTTSGTQSRDHVVGVVGNASSAASLEVDTGNGGVLLRYEPGS